MVTVLLLGLENFFFDRHAEKNLQNQLHRNKRKILKLNNENFKNITLKSVRLQEQKEKKLHLPLSTTFPPAPLDK